jgi:hypothetical protein
MSMPSGCRQRQQHRASQQALHVSKPQGKGRRNHHCREPEPPDFVGGCFSKSFLESRQHLGMDLARPLDTADTESLKAGTLHRCHIMTEHILVEDLTIFAQCCTATSHTRAAHMLPVRQFDPLAWLGPGLKAIPPESAAGARTDWHKVIRLDQPATRGHQDYAGSLHRNG